MDLSYLPDSVHLVYDSDSLITRAHNIFIDTAKAKMYACAVATQSGFHAMNIYDLFNPTILSFYIAMMMLVMFMMLMYLTTLLF